MKNKKNNYWFKITALNKLLKYKAVVIAFSLFSVAQLPTSGYAQANAVQQQRSVSGTVIDYTGQSLPGASVSVKGSTQSTVTNINGQYTLTNIPANATLQFSFIGMKAQEVNVGSKTTINVEMIQDAIGLEEAVAIGYGTRTKSLNTSSISSLSEKDLDTKSPTKNVAELLQGKASGIMVRNTGGSPGEEPMIRIRGMNSISGNNSALIVIDGLQRGSLSSLNPQDIKSIDILKGSNATAIYGSEGANGVILITTKMGGVRDKPQITFNSDVTVSTISKKLPKIGLADWARQINAIELADNLYIQPVEMFSQSEIAEFERTGGVDWQDQITQTGIAQNHNVSIDGGSNTTKYRVSGSFLDKKGIIITSGYERYTFQAKLDTKITDWLSTGVNLSGTKDNSNVVNVNVQTDSPILSALALPPIYPIYNDQGEYFGLGDLELTKWSKYGGGAAVGHPIANAKENDIQNESLQNNLSGFLLFTPLKGLTLRMEFGSRLNNFQYKSFQNNNTYAGNAVNGLGILNESNSKYFQNSNILNYKKTVGLHDFDISGVFEKKSSDYFSTGIRNSNFPTQSTSYNDLGSAAVQRSSSNSYESSIMSYLGRFTYNYNRRYLLSASYRADGSSVFGDNNKWAYFPSASVGWKASEEDFVANLGVFHNLMLRASYGLTGNQSINPYQTLAAVSVLNNRYPYYGGQGSIVNYGLTRSANPNLKWETTRQRDFGLDASFLNGSLQVSTDYYYKVTSDLLQGREIPSYTGLQTIIDNVGKLSNEGFEFSLDHSFSRGRFSMSNGFNISTNTTIILDLGDVDRLGSAAVGGGVAVNDPLVFLWKGEKWGQIYGWEVQGTWNLDEEQKAMNYGQLPGDTKFTDLNKDGKIDSEDRKFLGSVVPKFEYGFNSRMNYKNFGLSFLVQGVYGNKVFNATRLIAGYGEAWTNRWTPENQNTIYPGIGYWDNKTRDDKLRDYPSQISFPTSNYNANSQWIEDASYIRLKNVTFSYDLPKTILKKINSQNLSLFLSAKNLVTLTKYSGYNPEVSSFNNDKALGTSYGDYPLSREILVGLNLTF